MARGLVVGGFFAHTQDLLCVLDGPRVRAVNGGTARYGWSPADLEEHAFGEFVHPDDQGRLSGLDQGRAVEDLPLRFRLRDGSHRVVSFSSTVGTDGLTYVVGRDLTQSLAREQKLVDRQRDLERKDREIERASRARTDFLRNISHELRTPLQAILGFAELSLEDEALSPSLERNVREILASGQGLLSVLDGILELSGLETRRSSIEQASVADLDLIVTDAVAEATRRAPRRRFGLEIAQRAAVRADTRGLRQVLDGLLSNALKFSADDTPVDVMLDVVGGMAQILVMDRGPGISGDLLGRLFEPFAQGEDPLVKRHPGTGVGLAIGSRLVAMHGGSTTVRHREGGGTVFVVSLPLADPPSEPRFPVSAARRPQVLVVDDSTLHRGLARAVLDKLGCEVVEATSGLDGLGLAKASAPALALVELALPGIDGFATARAFRADPATHAIPLVALTTAVLEGVTGDRLSEAGFDDFLAKPLEGRTLGPTLRRLLERA